MNRKDKGFGALLRPNTREKRERDIVVMQPQVGIKIDEIETFRHIVEYLMRINVSLSLHKTAKLFKDCRWKILNGNGKIFIFRAIANEEIYQSSRNQFYINFSRSAFVF